MSFELINETSQTVQIKVIGVGGGGGNAVKRMVESHVQGAEFIAVNTDRQSLETSSATHKIQIGERATKGMGAGGNPAMGEKAAEEDREKIASLLRGADMVFITAGMGGGTGTGAAPVIAEIAKELGILTVGVVTKPFMFERANRMNAALAGIEKLARQVDSLIVIPNERLRSLSPNGKLSIKEAFAKADEVLVDGVRNISELIKVPAYINLDFADVCTVMKGAGYAHLGVGRGQGEDKAKLAAQNALVSPLLETRIDGANGLIINIRASEDLDLGDVDEAVEMITASTDPNAHVIWGILFDPDMDDEMMVTVIATGFDPETVDLTPVPTNARAPRPATPQTTQRSDQTLPQAPLSPLPPFDRTQRSDGAPPQVAQRSDGVPPQVAPLPVFEMPEFPQQAKPMPVQPNFDRTQRSDGAPPQVAQRSDEAPPQVAQAAAPPIVLFPNKQRETAVDFTPAAPSPAIEDDDLDPNLERDHETVLQIIRGRINAAKQNGN
ncbi:MAG: cell division protein FtsZ [Oscillospiraceae bacterium]|nr:cell division protein FtsZ [Oscillospiraceae bacterium]